MKMNALEFKIATDEFVEIGIAGEHISPDRARNNSHHLQCPAQLIKDFEREKRDLPLVIFFEIKIAIAAKPPACHALNSRHLVHREFIRLEPVAADEIVPARNVNVTDFHWRHNNITTKAVKDDGIASGQIIRREPGGTLAYHRDDLTVEEPLEIRVGPKTIATTMRTPGYDEELAAGFLVSEGVIQRPDQIANFSRPTAARNRENIMTVTLAHGTGVQVKSAQRFGTISSSCGICGKESIAAIRQHFPPIELAKEVRIHFETLLSLPSQLRQGQSDFARTGGIHAAGLFRLDGTPRLVREDIGRHNAVDKVIGRAFLDRELPLGRCILLVSGRASFEIMQKALSAGIPIVASVSAPSTLAMEFARKCNQTLVGFLRPPSFNIYSHAERIILD